MEWLAGVHSAVTRRRNGLRTIEAGAGLDRHYQEESSQIKANKAREPA